MSVRAGIVGLPNVGKSTLFNALTNAGANSENYPFCTIDPNVGVIPVPDPRLETISKYVDSDEVTPAGIEVLDIAGLVSGAHEGEGLGNEFLGQIREVDAIIHVVRCFEESEVAHVEGDVDPVRDIEIIETELILADLETVEKHLDKVRRAAQTKKKEAVQRCAALERLNKALEEGTPARAIDFPEQEIEYVDDLHLLTTKPVLYVANVGVDDVGGQSPHAEAVRRRAERQQSRCIQLSAAIEAELAQLPDEDQKEMLSGMGLDEPALDVLVRATYKLLGLHCFFTANENELRAWTTPVGSTAPEAAGVVHSDFEDHFIRAEVCRAEDLDEYGGLANLRDAGKLRVEGKDYVVQDGDLMYFRHDA